MNGNPITLIIVLVILIAMSAYFSATETAFSSLNRVRLKNLAGSGNKRAHLTLSLSQDYDRLLSTILIGNNIVNIASASIATVIFVHYFGDAGVTISTVIMTILVLIFGEISPKSLAKDAPESFAMASAPILKWLLVILMPLNLLFAQWKKLLSLIFRFQNSRGITEEELLTIVEEARQEGSINQQEGDLITNAIEFDNLEASDILTPRIDIEAVSKNARQEEITLTFRKTGYSRIPVYEDSIDNIIGVINQKDFYNSGAFEKKGILGILKPVTYVPKTMKLSKILRLLQQSKSHIVIVTDEYGGTMGMVTLEDILEELVGEIWDEHDEVIEEIRSAGENTYIVMGSTGLDKLHDYLSIDIETHSSTVSGWIIEQMGKIPCEKETFTFGGWLFAITKTTPRRILEINITKVPE